MIPGTPVPYYEPKSTDGATESLKRILVIVVMTHKISPETLNVKPEKWKLKNIQAAVPKETSISVPIVIMSAMAVAGTFGSESEISL